MANFGNVQIDTSVLNSFGELTDGLKNLIIIRATKKKVNGDDYGVLKTDGSEWLFVDLEEALEKFKDSETFIALTKLQETGNERLAIF